MWSESDYRLSPEDQFQVVYWLRNSVSNYSFIKLIHTLPSCEWVDDWNPCVVAPQPQTHKKCAWTDKGWQGTASADGTRVFLLSLASDRTPFSLATLPLPATPFAPPQGLFHLPCIQRKFSHSHQAAATVETPNTSSVHQIVNIKASQGRLQMIVFRGARSSAFSLNCHVTITDDRVRNFQQEPSAFSERCPKRWLSADGYEVVHQNVYCLFITIRVSCSRAATTLTGFHQKV